MIHRVRGSEGTAIQGIGLAFTVYGEDEVTYHPDLGVGVVAHPVRCPSLSDAVGITPRRTVSVAVSRRSSGLMMDMQ